MVEFSPATREARVRFPASALNFPFLLLCVSVKFVLLIFAFCFDITVFMFFLLKYREA